MTGCVYFLLYLALGKLSLMLLINYYYERINYFHSNDSLLKKIGLLLLCQNKFKI